MAAEGGNPLVATVNTGSWGGTANTESLTYQAGSRQGQFSTNALSKDTEGAGLFSDAASTIGDAAGGNWGGLAVDVVGDGMDALGMAMDPLGSLAGAGIGWLMEHIGFLKKPLDLLAGDPESVTAKAQTWTNVAKALSDAAKQYQDSARNLAGANKSDAVNGATATGGNLATVLQGASQHASDAAEAMKLAATAVGTTRGVIRDTVSQLIGDAIVKWAAATAAAFFTFGATEAAFIVDEVAEATSVATQDAAKVSKLVGLLEKFKGGAKESENTLKNATTDLNRGARNTDSIAHDASGAGGGHAGSDSSAPKDSGQGTTPSDAPGSGGTTPRHYWQKADGPSHDQVNQHVADHKQAVADHNQQVAGYNQKADQFKQDATAHNQRAVANQQARAANKHALDLNQQAMNRARAQGRQHDSLNAEHRRLTEEHKNLTAQDRQLGQQQQELTARKESLAADRTQLNEHAGQLQANQHTLAQEKGEDMRKQGSLDNAGLDGNKLVGGLSTVHKIWDGPIEGIHLGDVVKEPFAQHLSDQPTRNDAVGYESQVKQEELAKQQEPAAPAWPATEQK